MRNIVGESDEKKSWYDGRVPHTCPLRLALRLLIAEPGRSKSRKENGEVKERLRQTSLRTEYSNMPVCLSSSGHVREKRRWCVLLPVRSWAP